MFEEVDVNTKLYYQMYIGICTGMGNPCRSWVWVGVGFQGTHTLTRTLAAG
jgi:hypothetical protein